MIFIWQKSEFKSELKSDFNFQRKRISKFFQNRFQFPAETVFDFVSKRFSIFTRNAFRFLREIGFEFDAKWFSIFWNSEFRFMGKSMAIDPGDRGAIPGGSEFDFSTTSDRKRGEDERELPAILPAFPRESPTKTWAKPAAIPAAILVVKIDKYISTLR